MAVAHGAGRCFRGELVELPGIFQLFNQHAKVGRNRVHPRLPSLTVFDAKPLMQALAAYVRIRTFGEIFFQDNVKNK